MIYRLREHPYANARIDENPDTNELALISYNTLVVIIDGEGWMEVRGLCSQSTRRHISWFLRQQRQPGLDYSTARMCYMRELKYNIYTGEVRSAV